MVKQPKGLEYHAVFKPNMECMVKALQIMLEYNPKTSDVKAKEQGGTGNAKTA